MSVLSAQTIRAFCVTSQKMIDPFVERSKHEKTNMSYGLSACGYDVRLDQSIKVVPGSFVLASTLEKFRIPNNLVGVVHDKSTLARRGLACQNTVVEPGWEGWLTLELTNHANETIELEEGSPIAQILFHLLDKATTQPYEKNGKYQHQERGPQKAR